MGSAELRAQKAACEEERRIVLEKIERLKVAKSSYKDVKEAIQDLKKDVKSKADQSETWAGQKYDDYNTKTKDTFADSHYKTYLDGIEDKRDIIKDKINELDSRAWDLFWEIGRLDIAIAIAEAEEAAAAAAASWAAMFG